MLAALAGLTGCGDGTGPTSEELLGIWGGVEYEYTSDADPAVTEDLINELGATYSVTLIHGGTYEWQLSLPGSTQTGSGTFDVSGNRLTLTPDVGSPVSYSFTFDQIFLTLFNDEESYDFGAGEEPASLRILLDRF
jgi:hypothetical protein